MQYDMNRERLQIIIHRSNILSFNFAVICMAPDANATEYQPDRYTFTESMHFFKLLFFVLISC